MSYPSPQNTQQRNILSLKTTIQKTSNVDEELEQLLLNDLVEVEQNKIKLTKIGEEVAKKIVQNLDPSSLKIIAELKEFLNDLSQDELLAFIYFSYPDMVEESIKYEQILPKRKEIALRVYKKEKVSLEKAAEIAGLSIEAFRDLLKDE